jgi:hypothetical protein
LKDFEEELMWGAELQKNVVKSFVAVQEKTEIFLKSPGGEFAVQVTANTGGSLLANAIERTKEERLREVQKVKKGKEAEEVPSSTN